MTTSLATIVKMIESLPEPAQERVADHLREYLRDLQDEQEWDEQFKSTQPQLAAAARRVKQEIAAGHAQPMDDDKL
jgi:hypothetical protein